jgi:hypothetical protein
MSIEESNLNEMLDKNNKIINKGIEFFNELIETTEMSLNDLKNHLSLSLEIIEKKRIEQYKLITTILVIRLQMFEEIMLYGKEHIITKKEDIMSSLCHLKNQFSEITFEVLELMEKSVQNNEISENDYIEYSEYIMYYINNVFPVYCDNFGM